MFNQNGEKYPEKGKQRLNTESRQHCVLIQQQSVTLNTNGLSSASTGNCSGRTIKREGDSAWLQDVEKKKQQKEGMVLYRTEQGINGAEYTNLKVTT